MSKSWADTIGNIAVYGCCEHCEDCDPSDLHLWHTDPCAGGCNDAAAEREGGTAGE